MGWRLGDLARVSGGVLHPSSCARKVFHATRQEAQAHRASVYAAYGEEPDRPLHVYQCRECGGWHVGSRRVPGAQ